MTSKDIIKDMIENIVSGELKEFSKLESEAKLAKMYDCNRHTIRVSIQHLIERGYLTKVYGGATYVNKIPTNHLLSLSSMFDLHAAKNLSSKIFYFKKIIANDDVASKLQLDDSKEVWHILRARYINNELHHLENTFMPVSLFPNLTKEKCLASILYYVETELGYEVSHAHKTIESSFFTAREAELLNIEERAPSLVVYNIGYLTNGRPYEYSINKHRNKRIEVFSKR